jgi:hypothetical protein
LGRPQVATPAGGRVPLGAVSANPENTCPEAETDEGLKCVIGAPIGPEPMSPSLLGGPGGQSRRRLHCPLPSAEPGRDPEIRCNLPMDDNGETCGEAGPASNLLAVEQRHPHQSCAQHPRAARGQHREPQPSRAPGSEPRFGGRPSLSHWWLPAAAGHCRSLRRRQATFIASCRARPAQCQPGDRTAPRATTVQQVCTIRLRASGKVQGKGRPCKMPRHRPRCLTAEEASREHTCGPFAPCSGAQQS